MSKISKKLAWLLCSLMLTSSLQAQSIPGSGGGSGSGTMTQLTAGQGLGTTAGTCNSGAITTTGTLSACAVTATKTADYTVVNGDGGGVTALNSASSHTFTLPQATASGNFAAGWGTCFVDYGAGTLVISPTTSTILGVGALTLTQNTWMCVTSNGTDYLGAEGGPIAGGSGTPGGSNTQVQYNNAGAFGGIAGQTTDGTITTFASSDLKLAGATSGTTTLNATAVASGVLTLPAATDTLVGKATTDTLTNKTLTSPALTGTVTGAGTIPLSILATQAAGTLVGNATGSAASPTATATPVLGLAGTTKGTIGLSGNTSGLVTIQPAAAAGTWSLTLPTSAGSNGQALVTDGAGVTSWNTISSGSSGTPATANTTAVTVNANTTGDQLLQELHPANASFNTANMALGLHQSGIFSVTAIPTVTIKAKLCDTTGGGGTCITLLTLTSAAVTTAANNQFVFDGSCGVNTTGASGKFICHGVLAADLTSSNVLATTYSDANTAVSSAFDLTGANFIVYTVAFSSASASNSATGQLAYVSPYGLGGTVTSVAATVPGGFAIAGSPITSTGTLAITASGTSGGVLYYSGATTTASSALLAASQLVLGGGAGTAPATLGTLGTTTTLLHGNAAGAPTFGAVSLTADVSGEVAVLHGGTGLAIGTSGGIPYFASTSTMASSGLLTQYGIVYGGGAGGSPVATAVGTAGQVLTSNGAGVAPTFQAAAGGSSVAPFPQGRLTLQTGVPVENADQLAKTSIFYDCYRGTSYPNYNGTTDANVTITSCELTLALDATGNNPTATVFDIFGLSTGKLCTVAWTTSTAGAGARASAIHNTRGYWTNTGSIANCFEGTTNRGTVAADQGTLLGSFYTTAAGTTEMRICSTFSNCQAANGVNGCMCVGNAYNLVDGYSTNQDTNTAWANSATAWVVSDNVGGQTKNRINFVDSLGQVAINARFQSNCIGGSGTSHCRTGMCPDVTNCTPTVIDDFIAATTNVTSVIAQVFTPIAGLRFVQAMEANGATTVLSFSSTANGFGGAANYALSVQIQR